MACHTCIMTRISDQRNRPATSPAAAGRRESALDAALDADLFKALADPTRLRILSCLARCARACSVTEIAECCDVDFSVVARHLVTLARAGVLTSAKRGRTVWYSVSGGVVTRLRGAADALDPWVAMSCCDDGCCEGSGERGA